MTVDDSSSMLRSWNPDNLDPTGPVANRIDRACWTALNTIGLCTPYDETVAAQVNPGAADGGWSRVDQELSLFHGGHPPLLASAFNGQAYDPLIEYRPPKRANGTFLTEMNAGNTGNWETVQWQDGATWAGRPRFNFRTVSREYTQAWRDILSTRYMVNGDLTAFDSYRRTGTTGVNSRYDLPPHYYKTSVKWCNAQRADGSANPGALPAFSNCRDERYGEFLFPYYYALFGEHDGRTDNTSFPAFELVILDFVNQTVNGQGSITHRFFNEETGAMGSFTRSFAQEAQNFANWAAYYKNRLSATKTAASHAFADIDSGATASVIPRIGFSSINRLAAESSRVAANSYRNIAVATLPVASFEGGQRNNFFDRLLSFPFTWAGTPLQVSLLEVGQRFRQTGANAPIIHSCQRNYHILFTDGMWNVSPTSDTNPVIGNVDNTVPPLAHLSGISVYGSALTSGASWPNPIRDHRNASLTLADIALYYWMTDLRPDLPNEVLWTNRDPANWQHLNFVGMGYGVRGTLPSRNQAATLANMGNGAGGTFAWPMPAADSIHNVDDLWHASVNGFGRYVAAQSPDEFRAGLRAILTEILNMGGSRSGVGFTGGDLRPGDKFTYSVFFAPGWAGDLIRKSISPSGDETPEGLTAADQLAVMLTPTAVHPEPWRTVRKIFTTVWPGGQIGVGGDAIKTPFTAAAGSPFATSPYMGRLGATSARQANVVAYLRGDRSREGEARGQFRVRGHGPLGDIVNAKPVIPKPGCVEKTYPDGTPILDIDGEVTYKCIYVEKANPGYLPFSIDHKNRDEMVYVAANDGMLHAFDKELKERWAYIPSDVFRPQNEAGIVNLTFQESSLDTPFEHYYHVDATPRVLDVDFVSSDDPTATRKWRTVLVGGLGKGGTSYYALDITDAAATGNEAEVADRKVLWEFTHKNMGYTYGRPIITKTRAVEFGYPEDGSIKNDQVAGGKWIAILPSGYNNGTRPVGVTDINNPLYQPKTDGDGEGRLFFVDLETGKELPGLEGGISTKLSGISTGVGSPDTPAGLAFIGGYVHDSDNQVTTAVYGGDQLGNFWRFNLESENHLDWKKPENVQRMAVLNDGGGNPQWVTTEPWPERDSKNRRWVYVGTGGFRHDNDLTNTDTKHTFYAFRDGGFNGIDRDEADTFTDKKRSDLVPMVGAMIGGVAAVDVSNFQNDGWFEDAEPGYHFDVNPLAVTDVVVYAANKYVGNLNLGVGGLAGADPCSSATFEGKLFGRDTTGATILHGGNHSEAFSSGIADIFLVLRHEGGVPVYSIAVSSRDGRGLYAFKPVINLPIGNSFRGIPVRGGIRYIK
jgi:type IV pilus assembly protein PilY1